MFEKIARKLASLEETLVKYRSWSATQLGYEQTDGHLNTIDEFAQDLISAKTLLIRAEQYQAKNQRAPSEDLNRYVSNRLQTARGILTRLLTEQNIIAHKYTKQLSDIIQDIKIKIPESALKVKYKLHTLNQEQLHSPMNCVERYLMDNFRGRQDSMPKNFNLANKDFIPNDIVDENKVHFYQKNGTWFYSFKKIITKPSFDRKKEKISKIFTYVIDDQASIKILNNLQNVSAECEKQVVGNNSHEWTIARNQSSEGWNIVSEWVIVDKVKQKKEQIISQVVEQHYEYNDNGLYCAIENTQSLKDHAKNDFERDATINGMSFNPDDENNISETIENLIHNGTHYDILGKETLIGFLKQRAAQNNHRISQCLFSTGLFSIGEQSGVYAPTLGAKSSVSNFYVHNGELYFEFINDFHSITNLGNGKTLYLNKEGKLEEFNIMQNREDFLLEQAKLAKMRVLFKIKPHAKPSNHHNDPVRSVELEPVRVEVLAHPKINFKPKAHQEIMPDLLHNLQNNMSTILEFFKGRKQDYEAKHPLVKELVAPISTIEYVTSHYQKNPPSNSDRNIQFINEFMHKSQTFLENVSQHKFLQQYLLTPQSPDQELVKTENAQIADVSNTQHHPVTQIAKFEITNINNLPNLTDSQDLIIKNDASKNSYLIQALVSNAQQNLNANIPTVVRLVTNRNHVVYTRYTSRCVV